jgi:serine phosphatase RsbU (regulator of sigma subunit)
MGHLISEYQNIKIPKEDISALFKEQARKYAIMTFKIGGWLTPLWLILDYTMAPESFNLFLLFRFFGTLVLLGTAYLLERNKISINISYLIGYLTTLMYVSFMCSVVPKESLLTYILGYTMVVLVGNFFLLMKIISSLFYYLLSITILFVFNSIVQNHSNLDILNNGGYLFITLGAFGVGISYLHYLSEKKSIINRLRIQKSNEILKKQQKDLQIKNTEILLQKHALENKNKEITDSINYAKRIQNALLSLENLQDTDKLPEHYIFFQPRDIVSGDFYWEKLIGDYWYVCVADCTGHGVPGGFMSMLGISLFNNIVEHENQSPAQILDDVRHSLLTYLRSDYDGMDVSLCKINLNTYEIEWSGANNPLWIVKNPDTLSDISTLSYYDEFLSGIELKPDKQPVGKHLIQKPFTNHKLKLNKGDEIILFTDGYADQFGGPRGKKFKYRNFKLLHKKIAQLSIQKQKHIIESAFLEWKGNYEQIDDICVMGIKI